MKSYTEYIERIEKIDDKINAFVHFDKGRIALNAESQKAGILSGCPVAIKDNICVRDDLTMPLLSKS